MRAGSKSTLTSRLTPPSRVTVPTPLTASRALVTSLSTNHDRASSSMRSDCAVNVTIAPPEVVTLETIGSFISAGSSARTLSTALRTSVSAVSTFWSMLNSTMICAEPSVNLLRMCCTPPSVAILSSSLRATSVSSCAGAAPSSFALTMIVGNSISGKF